MNFEWLSPLLELLKSNIKTLKRAPIVFIIILALSFIGAIVFIRYFYQESIENLRQNHQTLVNTSKQETDSLKGQIASQKEMFENKIQYQNDRIANLQTQIVEYRAIAERIASSAAQIKEIADPEIKERTINFVRRLREFISGYDKIDRKIHEIDWSQMVAADSETDRRQKWQEMTNSMSEISAERMNKYNEQFKIDAIVLRDELKSRIPKEKWPENRAMMFEFPVNPIGLNLVADSLELMAKRIKNE